MELHESLPLLLLRMSDRVWGKTRFQKLMFLVQAEKTKKGNDREVPFSYFLYKHGPFSLELTLTIEKLRDDGFIIEDFKRTSTGNPIYTYQLTESGVEKVDKEIKTKPEIRSWQTILYRIISDNKTLELSHLVEKSYEVARSQPFLIGDNIFQESHYRIV